MIIRFEQYIDEVFLTGKKHSIEEIKQMYKKVKDLNVPISDHPDKFCQLFNFDQIPSDHYSGIEEDVVIDTDVDWIYAPIRSSFQDKNEERLNIGEAFKHPRKFRGIDLYSVKTIKGSDINLFTIVKEEIDRWNPYGLLPSAPDDEFFSEAKKVTRMISFESKMEEIAEIISKVFTNAFFDDGTFTIEKCLGIAQRIFDRLQSR